jgi:heme/copper-type cytochrome/quinol oxidase subunit 4
MIIFVKLMAATTASKLINVFIITVKMHARVQMIAFLIIFLHVYVSERPSSGRDRNMLEH